MRVLAHGPALVLLGMGLISCGSDPEPPPLAPPETFRWGGQPISFSPPPEGWRRGRSQNGGEEGVRFVKTGSVGEEIHVSERFFLGNRDRCDRMQELIRDIDNLDRQTFARKLQRSRPYANPALNASEARLARDAGSSLDEARQAFGRGDTAGARRAISAALEQARQIRYEIDEVVDRVLYSADQIEVPYIKATSEDPVPDRLAGEPAIRVNYRLEYSGRVYEGRRLYVVRNNRLFEAGFQGLEENLPLFERVLQTVAFPAGDCEH